MINTNVERNFVDIHLPASKKNTLKLPFGIPQYWKTTFSTTDLWKIKDLDTYQDLIEGSGNDYTIANTGEVSFLNGHQFGSGYYRIFFNYPQAYIDHVNSFFERRTLPENFYRPQQVEYELDYSQWTLRFYDFEGRLASTVPPSGVDCNHDPTLFYGDELKMNLEMLCTDCDLDPTPSAGTYIHQSTSTQEVCSMDVSLASPTLVDHSLSFKLEPALQYLPPSEDYCSLEDENFIFEHQPNLEPHLPPATLESTPPRVVAFKGPGDYIDNIVWPARQANNSIDVFFGGGYGNLNEHWFDVMGVCEDNSCSFCMDPESMGQWSPMHYGITHCRSIDRMLEQVELIKATPQNGYAEDFYCFRCGDLLPCKQEDGEFFRQFRIEVNLYGEKNRRRNAIECRDPICRSRVKPEKM